MTTCTRLIGKPGEKCRTCGRLIVRYDLSDGDYSLQHAGPTIAQKLRQLNEARRAADR